MKKPSLLFVFVCSLAITGLAACSSSGDDDDDDDVVDVDADTTPTPDAATTPVPDAAPAGGISDQYLDETCTGQQTDCGGLLVSTDYACLTFNAGDTVGLCASKCAATSDCTDGFDGPAGGQPQCVLGIMGSDDTYCAIVCTDNSHCPASMTCTSLGGGSICTPTQS